ncbi:MAG: hypothetical protein CL935_03850 [Deltaproteobacteria bacterium]|nr:hypothetical protein [Deltaproteobacteria bacterium]
MKILYFFKTYILVLACLFTFEQVWSKEYSIKTQSRIQLFENWMETLMEDRSLPGVSVSIVHGKDLVYSKGFGYSDLANQIPMTKNTSQPIASITKVFTSIGLMKLVEGNKINLEDSVVKYIPELKNLKSKKFDINSLTLRSILLHTTGLPLNNKILIKPRINVQNISSRLLEDIKNQKLLFQPNRLHKYSNLGMNLGGILIERLSLKKYSKYITDIILNPAGMTSSSFEGNKGLYETMGYSRKISGLRKSKGYTNMGRLLGLPSSGLNSNVLDISRFISWHFSTLYGDLDNIINRNTLNEMQTVKWVPIPIEMPPFINSGLAFFANAFELGGVGLGYFRDKQFIKHSGGLNGFCSELIMDNENQIGIIVLANSSDAPIYWNHNSSISKNLYEIIGESLMNPDYMIQDSLKEYENVYTDHHHFHFYASFVEDKLALFDLSQSFPMRSPIILKKLELDDSFEDPNNHGFYGKEFFVTFQRNSNKEVTSLVLGNNVLMANEK